MKLERLAARDAQAINRIDAALDQLVAASGTGSDALAAYRTAAHRDRAITTMRRHEALADALEALCGAQGRNAPIVAPEAIVARLTAIPGISKAKAGQIISAIEAG